MIKQRNVVLLILILSLVSLLLACDSGGSSEPTQAPPTTEVTAIPAEPTKVPDQPTTAPEPTEAIAEEPTKELSEDPSDESTETPPIATKTPPPENELFVDTINTFWDNYGYMHVVGLVTNNTNETFDNVTVDIDIFDSNHSLLYTINVSTDLLTLAPGETSSFSHQVSGDIPDPDSYATAIIFSQNPTEIERNTVKVEGTSHVVDDYGFVHVVGKLVNNTLSPAIINGLAAATFNENGDLITTGPSTALVFYLDPGEDSPFRVTMNGPSEESHIDNHEIYLDAVTAIPIEFYELTISDNHHYYLDASGGFHLIGEISNNHDEYLTVSLVAGIYDEKGNVVDANTTEIPTFSIAPEETLPYDFQYWGILDNKSGTFDIARNYYVQYDPYWVFSSPTGHIDLTTQNNSNQVLNSSQAYFTGEVLNNSNEEVRSATIIVSLFELETGDLIATGYGLTVDPIVPNGTANYEVWINMPADFDINSVEYTIVANGDLP